MTIRGTVNQTIISTKKHHSAEVGRGEARELVLAGATEGAAVMTEKRDNEARAAYQTATPSDHHNGTRE